jgi:hypothetical protein
MDKQIELLKSNLNNKIADLDRRLKKYEKDILIDHSGYRDRLHSEARGYERVLKMIDELPDPIPLPAIKPGDRVMHSDLGQVRIMSEPIITVLKGADEYEVYLSDLEVIPNGV